MIHSHALDIVTKLVAHGHTAYFAGGWVRDYVMKHPSDDIDIATSASPAEILDLFPRTLLVGLQFGVVIVLIEGHAYEVATFRKDLDYENGRTPKQIEPATPRIDALRRDFTINGMFYDPLEDKIHDYVGGMEDIEKGIIRAIGDPYQRFFEDRLRMIRAFRFSSRFDFRIDLDTEDAIKENAMRLFPSVAMERIWQEFSKMTAYPRFDRALLAMHRLSLLPVIFPELDSVPLHEMENRVKPLKNYPENAPKALFLHELLPNSTVDDILEIGRYLKISNKEINELVFYQQNFPYPIHLARYPSALFYAHPLSEMCLKIYAARLSNPEEFLKSHREKQKSLEWHIERLVNKTPLVSSKDLFDVGIAKGIQMGNLLKEAEKIAIEQDIKDTKTVLEILKLC